MIKIQLYDKGTPKGKQLFTTIEALCKRLQIDYDPEYVKDMNKIYSRGVIGNTILVINNEIVAIDKYPNARELEELVSDFR